MSGLLRVLVVEDNLNDADLLVRQLRRFGYDLQHERVDTPEAMRTAVAREPWDLIVSDYSMPRFDARSALAIVQEAGLDIPFIIVSGTVGEETAVEAMRAGAHDFMLKGSFARMQPAIERELREAARRRERIAERAHAEAERERLVVELTRAVEARDSFLGLASHELRTPLTALTLSVHRLKHWHASGKLASRSPEQVAGDLGRIDRQVVRIGILIENMLNVVHASSEGMRLSREPVDLAEVAKAAIERTCEAAPAPWPTIHLAAQPTTGLWDRLRVETIASNLVANAVKFGRGEPIDVTVSQSDGVARLVVTDRGIGIAGDDHQRIFEKFGRAVSITNYGGFGLGLWIVAQIVEAHGGRVGVRSALGEGAAFTVELPLAPPDDDAGRVPLSES